ncbi:hypothetical protein RAA17_10935 [Komagataeibacter rhaeticus]|nr:hypothetical protein [Komagataeibacter rhaeticus]
MGDEYDEGEPRTVNLRAIPATDYALFTPDSQQRFWHTPWRITPQSNRVGYRLAEESLRLHHAVELRSYGIVPGIVQVPRQASRSCSWPMPTRRAATPHRHGDRGRSVAAGAGAYRHAHPLP